MGYIRVFFWRVLLGGPPDRPTDRSRIGARGRTRSGAIDRPAGSMVGSAGPWPPRSSPRFALGSTALAVWRCGRRSAPREQVPIALAWTRTRNAGFGNPSDVRFHYESLGVSPTSVRASCEAEPAGGLPSPSVIGVRGIEPPWSGPRSQCVATTLHAVNDRGGSRGAGRRRAPSAGFEPAPIRFVIGGSAG